MRSPSRRAFFRSAAAAGLGLSTGRNTPAETPVDPFNKEYFFAVGPDTLVQLVQVAEDNRNRRVFNAGGRSLRTSILKANPWAIAGADQDLMPYLVGETPVPLVSDGSSVCVPCTASGGLAARGNSPENR